MRAAFDFVAGHPEVAASQHFHSSGGVVLRPPSVPDLELPDADRELYQDLARHGLEVTGHDLATSVYDWNWPAGGGNRKSGQLWRDADGEISEAEQLRFDDEELDGYAFREYTTFDHPQLGRVEIGGWRKFGHNNPPPEKLPEEIARNVDFVLMQAAHTPLLGVGDVETEELGGGVYRVTAEVRNAGYQPTELALRREQGRAVPVRVTLEGVEVLDAAAEQELGVLAGHARTEASWVVRGDPGNGFTVRLWHPKGGTATRAVRLPDGSGSGR